MPVRNRTVVPYRLIVLVVLLMVSMAIGSLSGKNTATGAAFEDLTEDERGVIAQLDPDEFDDRRDQAARIYLDAQR